MARMIKVKLIMELRDQGMARRSIAKTRHMSMGSVFQVFDIADERGITWIQVKDLGEEQVLDLDPPGKERARERVRGARLVVRPYGNGQGRGQPATAARRVQSPVRPRAQGGDGVHQVLRAARSTSGSASRRCKSTTPASASARSCLAAYFFSTRC